MSRKDLKCTPHALSNTQWWYEENAGITVVVEHLVGGVWHDTSQAFISWKALRAALKRKDRP